MKPLKIIGTLLPTFITVVVGMPMRVVSQTPQRTSTATTAQPSAIGAVLAQAGYIGTPLHVVNDVPFVQAKIGTTAVDVSIASGAPFDLWLDETVARAAQSEVYMTAMLSSYWTFTKTQGHWGGVRHFAIGASTLGGVEAKIEPLPSPSAPRASLGATALISRGAIIDYAADMLYLLSSSTAPAPTAPTVAEQPTLRAMLEHAGQYKTFLDLMSRAGLLPLLDTAVSRVPVSDSLEWLGLRVGALGLSGVGAMPVNDIHLKLTRQAIDQEIRGSNLTTVFAPTDDAFARLPADTLRALRADTARLARLLRAHIYLGAAIDTVAMRAFIRGAAHPGANMQAFGFYTLGSRIDVDRLTSWEDGRVVARATIVQPEMKTQHGLAVAHGIDRVLGSFTPPSPFATTLLQQGYTAVPLYRLEDGNGYFVQGKINDVAVQLTIESGASVEVALDQQWAANAHLSQGASDVVSFDSVKLGPVHIETTDFSGPIGAVKRQGYRATAGVVGSRLLAKYRARLDCAAGVLYLRIPH